MPAAISRSASPSGKVIALLPCKGGAGATFIAANLAHALSVEGHRTCLLDLNLPFGEAALYVTESMPQRGIADLAGQHERLDPALLDACLTPIAPRCALLAAADAPERALGISVQDIDALLSVARRRFEWVVIDLSRAIDAHLIRALDSTDEIHLVFQATIPFMRNAARLMRLMRALAYPEDQTRLFLNRHEKNSGIEIPEIEKALGKPVAYTLPNRFGTVAAAIDQGRPVIDLAPSDPISLALRALARAIAGSTREAEPARPAWWRMARRRA